MAIIWDLFTLCRELSLPYSILSCGHTTSPLNSTLVTSAVVIKALEEPEGKTISFLSKECSLPVGGDQPWSPRINPGGSVTFSPAEEMGGVIVPLMRHCTFSSPYSGEVKLQLWSQHNFFFYLSFSPLPPPTPPLWDSVLMALAVLVLYPVLALNSWQFFCFNLTRARIVCITISGLEIKTYNFQHTSKYFHMKKKTRILQADFRQTGFRLCSMCTFNLFEACSYSQYRLWKGGHQALFWLRNNKESEHY